MLSSASYPLAMLAGLLSTLSPCVLPLLPIVIGGAAAAHRLGPLALAGGVTLSFVSIGLFVASLGFAVGLDGDVFRFVGAAVMLGIGVVLLSRSLQNRLALATGGAGNFASGAREQLASTGWQGQLVLGLLLGAVWSPCVGPTLGAAATLAAQRNDLGQVAVVMVLFGLGAATPLILIGALSREALLRWRGRMGAAGQAGKLALGALLALTGLAILSGVDHHIEAFLVNITPTALSDLTTRF